MNNKIKIIVILVFLFFVSMAQAIDTKYFSAFTYKQDSILGSEYLFSPEFRFENGAKELYYYHFKTGLLFHPKPWLNLGFYVGFNNEKDLSGNWDPDNFFEFVIDPKIVFDFSRMAKKVQQRIEKDNFVPKATPVMLRLMDVLSYAEFELHDFDPSDPKNIHVVCQLRPEIRWQKGDNTYYVRDDIFYSFKFGQTYRSWTTFGYIQPYQDFNLDLYYIFEADRTQFLSPTWQYAHVFGSKVIWDRRQKEKEDLNFN